MTTSRSAPGDEPAARAAEVAWWVRYGLIALAVPQAITGIWALVDSSGWFGSFPGFDPRLVAAYPPFNAHLATDAGAGFFATAVGLVLAAWWIERRTARLALVTYLAFAVPHLLYHATHDAPGLTGGEQAVNVAVLVLAVVLAAGVWWGTTDRAARSVL